MTVHMKTDAAPKPAANDVWFVIRHRSSVVDMTLRELEKEGFEAYRPMITRMKKPTVNGRRATAAQVCVEPLYRDYMFVRRVAAGIKAIGQILGVEGGYLGGVRDAVIEAHKAREVNGFLKFVAKVSDSAEPVEQAPQPIAVDPDAIKAGDTVRLLNGLLEAVVTETSGNRVALLSEFMGGASTLVVSLRQVVKVAHAAPKPPANDAA